MNRMKGCVNSDCQAHGKRVLYKDSMNYCPQCGTPLEHVCKSKGCYTFLDDSDETYCLHCLAEKEVRKGKAEKRVLAVGGSVGAVAILIVTEGKETLKSVGKILK
jgi:predicted amidophosphoribosyltransferase